MKVLTSLFDGKWADMICAMRHEIDLLYSKEACMPVWRARNQMSGEDLAFTWKEALGRPNDATR